jgi:hypothetical protein
MGASPLMAREEVDGTMLSCAPGLRMGDLDLGTLFMCVAART